ncbi:MAG: hypothetical protein KBH01_02945 [Breznakibacter sp.]|nr:hypothetical protein [Breznakibacter sp.]
MVIRPRAGRAFTLFIRVVSVFIGPHDPLRSTTAAESKQSARLCRLAQPKNSLPTGEAKRAAAAPAHLRTIIPLRSKQ